MKAVRDHPDRPPTMQRHVLHMLALRLDWETGAGFASVRVLAADADASEHTAKRATAWARSAQLLVLTRRGGRIDAERVRASEWRLMLPADSSTQGSTTGTLAQGATGGTLGTQGSSSSGPKVPMEPTQGASGDGPSRPSSSRPSTSARVTASASIRGAFPDVTDEEIRSIFQGAIRDRHPRDPDAYIAKLAGNGSLRLPCDRTSAAKLTAACRGGNSARCGLDWCGCRCHAKPAVRDAQGAIICGTCGEPLRVWLDGVARPHAECQPGRPAG